MKCPNCQEEIKVNESTRFCPFCGTKLEAVNAEFESKTLPETDQCKRINSPENYATESPSARAVNTPTFNSSASDDNKTTNTSPLKMRSSCVYAVVVLMLSMVTEGMDLLSNNEDYESLAIAGAFLGLLCVTVQLIFLFILNIQWCKTINTLAKNKTITPHIINGIMIGFIIICALSNFPIYIRCIFAVVLWNLDKVYKKINNNVPLCWNKSLNFSYIIIAVAIIHSLLGNCNNFSDSFIWGIIKGIIGSILIYSIQTIFNFAICSSEYTNKEYVKFWQDDYKKFGIFVGFLLYAPLIFLGIVIVINILQDHQGSIREIRHMIEATLSGIFISSIFLVAAIKAWFVPKCFKQLDQEIKNHSEQ